MELAFISFSSASVGRLLWEAGGLVGLWCLWSPGLPQPHTASGHEVGMAVGGRVRVV